MNYGFGPGVPQYGALQFLKMHLKFNQGLRFSLSLNSLQAQVLLVNL